MSHNDSNFKSLLSPTRSGTFFAPFRARSANPDGFDSKMKLWISAIEEWAVAHKRLTISLKDIHQIFVSDAGIRPDKECVRLVLSEMKRRVRIVPMNTLRNSTIWANDDTIPYLDNFIDPKGWLGWGVKKLVYNPASWAISAIRTGEDKTYSDFTDSSITDNQRFVCLKSLHELSQILYTELIRISKAEKQYCFEWQHLLELITPIMNTITDATDSKDVLEILDILVEYLAIKRHVSIQIDNETKLIKVANNEDSPDDDVIITKKDIAMARLLRAKELLTADADRYHSQAARAKAEALNCYNRKEIAKAKSLLRSHKRLSSCAEQKESQLTNVEIMLEQLENTNSNMMILQAYKDGAEALKIANTNLEANTSVLDDVYDVTAEAHHVNNEMSQMLNNISCLSQPNVSQADLEAELNEYIANQSRQVDDERQQATTPVAEHIDDLEERLNNLVVCQDDPLDRSSMRESTPRKKQVVQSATE